jgi:hypothetical protein
MSSAYPPLTLTTSRSNTDSKATHTTRGTPASDCPLGYRIPANASMAECSAARTSRVSRPC